MALWGKSMSMFSILLQYIFGSLTCFLLIALQRDAGCSFGGRAGQCGSRS